MISVHTAKGAKNEHTVKTKMSVLKKGEKMAKLKPCPFCGGTASKESKIYGNTNAYSWVFCLKCGCSTPKIPMSLDYSASDKSEELWNRRARTEAERSKDE